MNAPTAAQLREALATRVVIADGGMGTMLQAAGPTLEDFQGYDGCNEVLNVSRPDIVRSVHQAYVDAGCDAVETNTFGANLANLGEYGIPERIYELARAGAELAREYGIADVEGRQPPSYRDTHKVWPHQHFPNVIR